MQALVTNNYVYYSTLHNRYVHICTNTCIRTPIHIIINIYYMYFICATSHSGQWNTSLPFCQAASKPIPHYDKHILSQNDTTFNYILGQEKHLSDLT